MSEQELNIQFKASKIRWSRRDEQMMKEWFTRKQRSINWMCSPHVEWCSAAEVRKRGSVCPARKMCEEEKERAFTSPFILPRKEWDESSSLVEIINALNNNLKFFPLHVFYIFNPTCFLVYVFLWLYITPKLFQFFNRRGFLYIYCLFFYFSIELFAAVLKYFVEFK